MKAKCPYCEAGCDKCQEGYIDVRFATIDEGHYHFMVCNNCGCETGGHLHRPGEDMPMKPSKYTICPNCRSQDLDFCTCEEAS